MNKYLIGGVAVALVALGVWQKDAIQEKWETRGMTEQEKDDWELKHDGAIKEDGEIDVDDEFDAELNDMEKELRESGASGSDDLDDLEKEQ